MLTVKIHVTFSSGGTFVTVSGTNLDVIRQPRMYLRLSGASSNHERCDADTKPDTCHEFDCEPMTATRMTCLLPVVSKHWLSAQAGNISYGFQLDDIQVFCLWTRQEPYFVSIAHIEG